MGRNGRNEKDDSLAFLQEREAGCSTPAGCASLSLPLYVKEKPKTWPVAWIHRTEPSTVMILAVCLVLSLRKTEKRTNV